MEFNLFGFYCFVLFDIYEVNGEDVFKVFLFGRSYYVLLVVIGIGWF